MTTENIPPHFLKLAERAKSSKKAGLKAAVRLFCIQCYGWNQAEARSCDTTGCPLHAQNLLVFRRGVSSGAPGSTIEAPESSDSHNA